LECSPSGGVFIIMRQIIYDIETWPNCFQFGWIDADSDARGLFEISDRRDDRDAFFSFLADLYRARTEMVGFNNLFFDYPIVHALMLEPGAASANAAYQKAQQIISEGNSGDRWNNMVWASDRFIPQIDLYMINHFDNRARTTSLKALEFAMRAESIEDLPFPPGTVLTPEQTEKSASYCLHDVAETKRFAGFNAEAIAFRRGLIPRFGSEVLNWSDGKIGRQFIIKELGDDACFIRKRGQRRQPRGTFREKIVVKEIIFPYIAFRRPECREVLQAFQHIELDAAKPGAISNISCELDGFRFDFGVGGLHGSQVRRIFRATDERLIVDVDVTSLYPSIAIENGMFPEHLGPRFTDIYRDLRTQRGETRKGTLENAILKLALNVPYGDSNNVYSPLFDPRYTMQTTINGQLLLLVLAERLLEVPTLEIIQINTDGVTLAVNREAQQGVLDTCQAWERHTKLTLEYKGYNFMAVRDVNNYIARDTSGNVKRKGAYDWPAPDTPIGTAPSGPRAWHGDQSAMVIQQAAEAYLLRAEDVAAFIGAHANSFDFMLRFKTPRTSQLYLTDEPMQRVTRYYAATDGGKLYKVMPPIEGKQTPGHFKRKPGITDKEYSQVLRTLDSETVTDAWLGEITRPVWSEQIHTKNKSTYEDRTITIHEAAACCNRASDFDWRRLNRAWYVAEALKLVECFAHTNPT
jgi:hypothetical protein